MIRHWLLDSVFRRLLANTGILLSGQVVTAALALPTLVLAARTLGVADFGLLVLVQTYVIIVAQIANFETWQGLIRYGAEARAEDDAAQLKGQIAFAARLDAITALAGTGLALAGVGLIARWLSWEPHVVTLAYVYALVVPFRMTGTAVGVLRLFDRFKLFPIQEASVAGLKFAAVAVAIAFTDRLEVFMVIWMVADALTGGILWAMAITVLHRQGLTGWYRAQLARWREVLAFNWWTSLSTTIGLPTRQFEVFIVAAVVSVEGVAVYHVFKRIAEMVNRFGGVFRHASYPQLADLVARAEPRQAIQLAFRSGAMLVMLTGLPAVLLAASAPWWLGWVFGPTYASYWTAFAMLLVFKLATLAVVGVNPLFFAMGFARANAAITACMTLLFLPTAAILGYRIGINGVILANLLYLIVVIGIKIVIIYRSLSGFERPSTIPAHAEGQPMAGR